MDLFNKIRKILNELNSTNQRYLDSLLDKVSQNGIDSLTPDEKQDLIRMSNDENIQPEVKPELPPELKSSDEPGGDLQLLNPEIGSSPETNMFFKVLVDRGLDVPIPDTWNVRVQSTIDPKHIYYHHQISGIDVFVIPFFNSEKGILFITDESKDMVTVGKIPQTEDGMEHFIDWVFGKIIPKMLEHWGLNNMNI